jgi:hypothetical protein
MKLYVASGSAPLPTHQWKILGAREQYLAPSTGFLWWEISST